jgi:ribosomal protein S18 acetylase RimI-like enzyme
MFTICLPDDAEVATEVLTEAFTGDPLISFLFPDPDRHVGQLRRMAQVTAQRGIAHGHGYGWVEDGHLLGVAMWSPPGKRFYTAADGQRLGDTIVAADPGRADLVWAGLSGLGAHHPDEPHFHLQMFGVRNAARGRGIGAELLAGTLELVDRVGAAANLESSNPRNVSIYERHGFEVVAEVVMPDGGPVIRPMFRPSRR